MTEVQREARSRFLPFLLIVIAGALAVAAFVAFQEPDGPALRVGSTAPGFSLDPLEQSGTAPISLEELRGRVVFVNFWATWCPPCRDEAPSMQRLYSSLQSEPFEMLAISIDTADAREAIAKFRDEFGLSFPILLDPEKRTYDRFQVMGVPESFLLDAKGRLAERFIGPKDWDDPRYARAIRRLIEAGRKEAESRG